jgi:hypothetical protein
MISLHPELMWQLAAYHRRDLDRSAALRWQTADSVVRASATTSAIAQHQHGGNRNISEPWFSTLICRLGHGSHVRFRCKHVEDSDLRTLPTYRQRGRGSDHSNALKIGSPTRSGCGTTEY